MASDIAKLIDAAIREDLAKRLKAAGFKKHSRTFVREAGSVLQIVNVQASQSNFEDRGQFTLNFGVYFPAVARRKGIVARGEYPKEYESTYRERVGLLMPNRTDHWWEITPQSHISDIGSSVGDAYERYGASWLAEMSSLERVFGALVRLGDVLGAAAVALELGHSDEAGDILRDAFAKARSEFQPTLRRFAERNGISLDESAA